VPGVGKTTLAHALAVSLGLKFSRVQFTADLMPSDLVGVSVFERSKESFVFHPGPVFTQVLLADEINRAGPKTQSALLEAMEEHQVSVENETRPLPKPFFVIATLSGEDRRGVIERLGAVMSPAELVEAQGAVQRISVSDALLDYLQALIAATRSGQWFTEGLSPRAGIAILRASRARALLARRDYVAPDDVQAILPQAAAHRLLPVASSGRGRVEQVRAMIEAIGLP
jgi:MoxR-like ATPase